jgi:hypothetical protein
MYSANGTLFVVDVCEFFLRIIESFHDVDHIENKLSIRWSSNINEVDDWVRQHFDDWHKHVNINCKDTVRII